MYMCVCKYECMVMHVKVIDIYISMYECIVCIVYVYMLYVVHMLTRLCTCALECIYEHECVVHVLYTYVCLPVLSFY